MKILRFSGSLINIGTHQDLMSYLIYRLTFKIIYNFYLKDALRYIIDLALLA